MYWCNVHINAILRAERRRRREDYKLDKVLDEYMAIAAHEISSRPAPCPLARMSALKCSTDIIMTGVSKAGLAAALGPEDKPKSKASSSPGAYGHILCNRSFWMLIVVHSVLVIQKNATAPILLAAGAKSPRPKHFADNCLVDSLRSVGIKVPYTKAGPFWALKDGDDMLAPFGRLSKKVSVALLLC